MATQATQVGAPSGSTPAPAAPATTPAPSTGSGGAVSRNAEFVRKSFSDLNPSVYPDEPQDATNPPARQADPSADEAGRQPANPNGETASDSTATTGTENTSTAPAAKEGTEAGKEATKATEPLPGDDIIAVAEALAKEITPASAEAQPPKPTETEGGQPLPTGEEEAAKFLNPDGKLTPAEEVKQARSYVGKIGRTIGEFRQAFKEVGKYIQQGQDGKPSFNLEAITDAMGADNVRTYLADRGLRLVPADAKVDGDGEDEAQRDAVELVNQLVPGDELTPDEKRQQIASDPVLNAKLSSQLFERDQARKAAARERQSKTEAADRAFAEQLKALPYFNDIRDAVIKWNRELPNQGSFTGEKRNRVIRLLAEAGRTPSQMRQVRDAAIKARDDYWQKRIEGSALPSGSGAATHVDMGRAPAQVSAQAANIRKGFADI